MYVAGKQRKGNHIIANVRAGPSRTQADWDDLCGQITKAWDEIVGVGLPKVRRAAADQDTSLRSVILLGGLLGGLEVGFSIPPAGGDVQWMRENWEAFNKRAEEGDEDFADMVREVKERGLLEKGSNGFDVKAEQRRLDELLGWGDYA